MLHSIKFIRRDTGEVFELESKIIDNKDASKNEFRLYQCMPDAPLKSETIPIRVMEQIEAGASAENEVESVVVIKADTSRSMADFERVHDKIAEVKEEIAALLFDVTAKTAEIKALIAEYKELRK